MKPEKQFEVLAPEGDPLLVAASVAALRDFHFRPFLLNGVPLSVESQVGSRFGLKGKGDKVTGKAEYASDVPYRPEFRGGAVSKDGILILSPRKSPVPMLFCLAGIDLSCPG